MRKFVKLPVEIEAIRFRGGNFHEVWDFVGKHRASHNEDHWIKNFNPIGTYSQSDDRSVTAEVWDELHSTWVGVKDGQWIIRGVRGEYYPCDDAVFRETYVEVEDDPREITFEMELSSLLNRFSKENASGTPDFILATFLNQVLWQFECAVMGRAKWRDESVELPALIAHRNLEDVVATHDDLR